MAASFFRRLKSKVQSRRCRRREVYSASSSKSQCSCEQTRSQIAAEILLREQSEAVDQELYGKEFQKAVAAGDDGDATWTKTTKEPFPGFDWSVDSQDTTEDVFAGVSSEFWNGRQRSWSWASNTTCVQVSDQRRREQDLWPLSLKPVANLVTGEVVYAPVPFFLFPGYYEEDPPLCEFAVENALEQGEFSNDSGLMDESLEREFATMHREQQEGNTVEEDSKWRFIDVVASKRHCKQSSECQKGRDPRSWADCVPERSKAQGLKQNFTEIGGTIQRLCSMRLRI
ncbi:hypothetical protein E8E14_012131 [Neopestalotiopsis sp. 37M]|nr:hypothetical protein E8E14_012131 [Neopestalotiopsis sp. 37M]